MITLKHSVNLITEIDENKMPSQLLTALTSLDEITLNRMLAKVFADAIIEVGALDKINEDNTYAVVKFGKN